MAWGDMAKFPAYHPQPHVPIEASGNMTDLSMQSNFSEQFRKLINRYKIIGYNLDILRQTACLVVNPITVDSKY